MTDWIAQTQAGVDRWLEAERAWWAQVLGGEGAAGSPAAQAGPPADLARKAIEAWRESSYRVIDAQALALLGALGDRTGTEAQALLRRWTDAQRKMWQDWLAVTGGAADAEGRHGAQDWPDAGREMLESLRQAAEHLVNSQAEWAKAWTDAEAESGRQGGP
jgi:hypothetical protein